MATPQRPPPTTGNRTTTPLPPSTIKQRHHNLHHPPPITPAATQTQYIFPPLKNPEILQCLNELGIDFITKAELSEPHRYKEKIRKLFWTLLENCRGITEDDIMKQLEQSNVRKQIHNNDNNNNNNNNIGITLPYPELHDNVIDCLFFKELRTCFIICGIYDFSFKDLHYPKSKRLRIQLSAVINMAKFREEQLKIYSELNEPRAELLAQLEDLHEEQQQLNEQLQHVEIDANTKLGEMDTVINECQQLEMEISKNNKLQASKREHATTLKREANDIKDELASTTWELQEMEAEEERLMGKVVSSPNRRTNELKIKQEKLDEEKTITRELEDKIQQMKSNIVLIQQSMKAVQDTTVPQIQVRDEATKYEHVMGQIDDTMKKINIKHEKTQQIQIEIEEEERGLIRIEEKITHMRKQGRMKFNAAQESLEIVNQQLRLVEKENRENLAKIDASENEVRSLEIKMQKEQQKANKEIQTLIDTYKQTENAFLQRNEKRIQAIAAAGI